MFLFYRSFSVFFAQDDFFIFSIVNAASLKDYLNFFVPRADTTNYRPLCLQTYYLIFYQLFGLNTFYYHLFPLILHAVNGVLVFKLLRLFLKKTFPAVLAAFLFVVSWTHFYSLNWVVCNCNGASLFFILLYFLTFLVSGTNRLFIPEIMFIGALFSNETAVAAPLLLSIILVFLKKIDKTSVPRVVLHFTLVILYIFYRFVLHAAPTANTYTVGLSIKSFKNLGLFLLWLFNASEEMVVHLKFRLFFFTDAWFFKQFPVYGPILCVFLSITVFFLLYAFLRERKKLSWQIIIFGAAWFIVGIMPVLFIPNRVYPYYPYLSQIGFWIILAHLITTRFSLINIIFLLLYVATNIFTLRVTYQSHWLPQESLQTKYYLQKFKKLEIPKNTKDILIPIKNRQARNGLMDGKAFNVVLNNYKINFYLEEKNVPEALWDKVYKLKIE